MNPGGAVAEEAVVVVVVVVVAAAAASSSALRRLPMGTSRWAVVHVMLLTDFFPGHPSVLMRASLLGLSAPSSRSRPSPSCASAWHNLSHDQEAAHDTYNVCTYANRMRCTVFVHHQGLFSIQEFRGYCMNGTCRGESHAIENDSERAKRGSAGTEPTLRFLYLLFGCPAVADPPAVLVARLVRISSMSCSAVDCAFSAVVALHYTRVSLECGSRCWPTSGLLSEGSCPPSPDTSSHGRFGARASSGGTAGSILMRSSSGRLLRFQSSSM